MYLFTNRPKIGRLFFLTLIRMHMKRLMVLALLIPCLNQAMDIREELKQGVLILAGGAAAGYAYSRGAEWLSNTINSQETHQMNVYFTKGKPHTIHDGPAPKWGLMGSLWMGVPFWLAARLGTNRMDAHELIKPVATAYGASAAVSLLLTSLAAYTTQRQEKSKEAVKLFRSTSFLMNTLADPLGLIGYVIYKRVTH